MHPECSNHVGSGSRISLEGRLKDLFTYIWTCWTQQTVGLRHAFIRVLMKPPDMWLSYHPTPRCLSLVTLFEVTTTEGRIFEFPARDRSELRHPCVASRRISNTTRSWVHLKRASRRDITISKTRSRSCDPQPVEEHYDSSSVILWTAPLKLQTSNEEYESLNGRLLVDLRAKVHANATEHFLAPDCDQTLPPPVAGTNVLFTQLHPQAL